MSPVQLRTALLSPIRSRARGQPPFYETKRSSRAINMYKTERVSFSRDSGCFPPFLLPSQLSPPILLSPVQRDVIVKSRASVVADLHPSPRAIATPLSFRLVVSASVFRKVGKIVEKIQAPVERRREEIKGKGIKGVDIKMANKMDDGIHTSCSPVRDPLVNFISNARTIELWKFQLWSHGEPVAEIDAIRGGGRGKKTAKKARKRVYTSECVNGPSR